MPDVRSLTTVLDFAVEHAGLKEYERKVTSTLDSIKHQIQTIGRLFGATIAIDVGKTLLFGIADAVRSANKLSIQLGQILTPGEDVKAVTDDLFRIAQDIGEEYGVIGDRFKAMLPTAKEFGVSTETTLAALENISKATEVNRLNGEQTEQVFQRINMAMRRGVLSIRTYGELFQEAPIVIRTLIQALGLVDDKAGTAESKLRALAKAGKLTSDVILKAFAKDNPLLQGEWEAKADTLGEAFNYAYNWIIKIGQALWKGTKGIVYIAKGIRWLTDVIVNFGKRSVAAVGGLDNALQLLQVTFGVIFSYYTIGMVIGLAKALYTVRTAAALASLKFLAIAAAIGLIVIAIEDVIGWTQGKDSLTGRMLGPYEEFSKKFEPIIKDWKNQFDLLIAPATALIKLLTADYSGAFTTLIDAIKKVQTPTDALMLVVGGVTAAYGLWNLMSFAAFILTLGTVRLKTVVVKTTAWAVEAAYLLWNGISFVAGLIASLIKVIVQTELVTGAAGAAKAAFVALDALSFAGVIAALAPLAAALTPILAAMAVIYAFKPSKVAAGTIDEAHEKAKTDAKTMGLPEPTREQFIHQSLGDPQAEYERIVAEQNKAGKETSWASKQAEEQRAKEALFPTATEPPKVSWWNRTMPTWLGGESVAPSVVPSVAPGAVTPVKSEQNLHNEMPIHTNVVVTANVDLATLRPDLIQVVDQAMIRVQENAARQLTRAAPATEARTGG